MQQILLDSKREKFTYNEDKFIRVNLDSNQGLLPASEISSSVNEYEQYFAEYDASNKYRLIFTINPVCSNVLFNNITEVVYNEGSDNCAFFGKQGVKGSVPSGVSEYNNIMGKNGLLDRYSLIEDTSYSHIKIGPLVYHCGSDIFNNHTLRAKEFTVINRPKEKVEGEKKEETIKRKNFNTLSDFLRDQNGNYVKDYKLNSSNSFDRHLYTINTVKPFSVAFEEKLGEVNGWFGFRNPTSLNVDNVTLDSGNTWFSVNKCMNNNKPGEFIDMYPDRSLYSFIPKYNKHRKRLEYNWEYCLTYPYAIDDKQDLIYNENFDYNGLECSPVVTNNIFLNEDNKILLFKTYVKHNLTTSNKVRIAMIFNSELTETSASIPVVEIGNGGYDGNHYFGVRINDIMVLMNKLDQGNDGEISLNTLNMAKFMCVKYVNGARCRYYFRKFRKIPNFNGTNVFQDGNITDEEILSAIENKKQVFNATLNKMGFAENIYSDKIAEIVFNDDIITTGLKDNLGRELSEIYLTIIKTNYGHEKWYNKKTYCDQDIEFSHCFGKISSGIDMENGKKNYNVHTLHNIPTNEEWNYIQQAGEPIETDITINQDDFYGDLVELSPYTLEETTLENVYHRFNTAQRECVSDEYRDIYYDDIIFDDFDIPQKIGDKNTETNEFEIRKAPYCTTTPNEKTNAFPGNLAAEGYYYQPHHKIKLKTYSEETSWGSNQKIAYELVESDSSNGIYRINTAKNYYFNVKDEIILYNKETLKRLSGIIIDVSGKNYTQITLQAVLETDKTLNDYTIFKINPIRPSTAYDLDDGTGRYVWRNFLPASEMTKENELYDTPFVNGAHYLYKGINFYLRRQDPYGLYGLSFNSRMPLPLMNFIVSGKDKDVYPFDYLENNGKTC